MRSASVIGLMLTLAAIIIGLSACDQIEQVLFDGDSSADEPMRQEIIDSITYAVKDIPIMDVTAEILESAPPQVNLHIKGYFTDSCTTMHQTTEWRLDNTIHIQVTTKRPIDLVCAAVITEIEHIVSLGTVEPGKYQVIVNDFSINFKVD